MGSSDVMWSAEVPTAERVPLSVECGVAQEAGHPRVIDAVDAAEFGGRRELMTPLTELDP